MSVPVLQSASMSLFGALTLVYDVAVTFNPIVASVNLANEDQWSGSSLISGDGTTTVVVQMVANDSGITPANVVNLDAGAATAVSGGQASPAVVNFALNATVSGITSITANLSTTPKTLTLVLAQAATTGTGYAEPASDGTAGNNLSAKSTGGTSYTDTTPVSGLTTTTIVFSLTAGSGGPTVSNGKTSMNAGVLSRVSDAADSIPFANFATTVIPAPPAANTGGFRSRSRSWRSR